jgi:uridine kinase
VTEHVHGLTKPVVIGIAGCSGSGKSTLAAELARTLDATLFPLDLYYRDLSRFPLDSRHKQNFDHPDSLELELIVEHVRGLAAGEAIQRPVYNFRTHSRVDGKFATVTPKRFLIVEGILALHYAELLPLYADSVYVDAPHEVCLARRIDRDMHERRRTEESIREQFRAATWPMAEMYVLPCAARSSIRVDGTQPVERSAEQVLQGLRAAGLLLADSTVVSGA